MLHTMETKDEKNQPQDPAADRGDCRKQIARLKKRMERDKLKLEALEKQHHLPAAVPSLCLQKEGVPAAEEDESDKSSDEGDDSGDQEVASAGHPVVPAEIQKLMKKQRSRALNRSKEKEKEPAKPSDTPKEARVRASKLEYKKLDELWSKAKHDFYLAESTKTQSGAEDEWEEYVFIVRRKFDYYNKPQKTYVDIKSPLLRNILREIFGHIDRVSLREDKPSIDNSLLFNFLPQIKERYEKLKTSLDEGQNGTTAKHVAILMDYLSDEFAGTARRLYPLLEHEEITFDLLWGLFIPGTLIFTTCPGTNQPRCLKLDWSDYKTQNGRTWYQLDCRGIDFNGRDYCKSNVRIDVEYFYGTQRIDSLNAFPLAYHEDEQGLREQLIERGRKFGTLGGTHHKNYDGPAFYKIKEPPGLRKMNVRGRIMVDALTFRRILPDYEIMTAREQLRASLRLMRTSSINPFDLDYEESSGGSEDGVIVSGGGGVPTAIGKTVASEDVSAEVDPLAADAELDITARPQKMYRMSADKKLELFKSGMKDEARRRKKAGKVRSGAPLEPSNMGEELLLICSPTVNGFSFQDKQWLEFSVAHISDVEFSTDAFESLVMPEEKKSMVKALVQSHVNNGKQNTVDDVIKGKGRGLVAVLHGRPGVGKTLTAEGIADHLKRPLYMVSAGELGTDSAVLEKRLTNILDISFTWNAVLLIDEADVFLERRSVHDMHRNSLVSIFLRVLEYFQGILFLTTNRVETFDEAFQSRIHIALRYDNLDQKAQRTIWSSFLDKVALEELPAAEREGATPRKIVDKKELDRICRRNLNGRQIKNAVRSAQVMAADAKEPLAFKHINMVLEITQAFEHDLKGTGQIDGMMSYA